MVETLAMLLGTKEVAVLLGVCERTAIRLFESGEVRAFQIRGKLWRTRREIVDSYIRTRLGEPAIQLRAPAARARHVA